MSIRLTHLAVLLAITTIAAAIGGVAATWWIADREFRDVLDDDLEMQTDLLAELLTDRNLRLTPQSLEAVLADAFESDAEETLWVTVYDRRDGTHVSNLPHDIAFTGKDEGALEVRFEGYAWRGFREDEDHFVVQVMRREDLYRSVQGEILEDIITPALIASGINLLLLGLLIGFFLWPLTRLARQVEARSADSLSPLEVRTPGREIGVLRDSLNHLMRDVEEVLSRERRFASDVAHELRTPLTTLKLELAGDEPDLPAVKSEIDRLSRFIEQLLTLARLEQGQWRQRFEAVALHDICHRAVERLEPGFSRAGMTIECRANPATVDGDATLLEILVRNLLQNVLLHCPAGTRADVTVDGGDGVRLRVSDTGPGLGDDLRRQMAHGFTRLDSKSEGLGLGLAICHRIAEVHDARLAFAARDDGSPGLVVTLTFARPTRP